MSQLFHRSSKSSYIVPPSPPVIPTAHSPQFRLDFSDFRDRTALIPSTERRSQVMQKLYSLVREAVPGLPALSQISSEEHLLEVIKSGIAAITEQNQSREMKLKSKEAEVEKAGRRVALKEQQLESKLREVELYRNKFLIVRKEATSHSSEYSKYENRSELLDLEMDLETQLSKEANERLQGVQNALRTKERRLQTEISLFNEEKSRFSEDLRVFAQQKMAIDSAEIQIQKDQETASRQLTLVDQKLAELTDIKERQEKKLRIREEMLRVRESELMRKEGQVRDAQKDMQENRTRYELQLSDLKKTILILESQLEEKMRLAGEFASGKTSLDRLLSDLKTKEQEATEHLRIKEKELTQREKVLNALSASLEEEKRCLQVEKLAVVEAKATSLRANVTVEMEERVNMMREDVGSHAQRLENYAEWLVTRETELEAWKGSVLEDKECIENSAVMLDELQVEIENQRMELETEKRQVKEESKHIAAAMKKVKAAMKDIEEKTRQLKSKEVMLSHSEAMLNERKISLEQFEKALDLRETALREEERPQGAQGVDPRKDSFTLQRRSEYLTPRDVITPRSTEDSAVFT